MFNKRFSGFAALVLGCLTLSACGATTTPTDPPASGSTPTSAASTPGAATQTVRIVARDNMFEPISYTVQGSSFQIVAVNEGQAIHEVEVKELLPETKLAPGQSKAVDLTDVKPGTYKIYCEIHEDQGMEGELLVK